MGLKKQIIQIKNGKQVAIYNSAKEAAKALNVSEDRIYKQLSKQTKKDISGFTFQHSGVYPNKVVKDGDFKCPYCDKRFDTYNGLTKHIFRYKEHGDGITQEQLLTDFKYNGVRPTCKCGCGGYTNINYGGGAHFLDYIVGHQNRIHNNWGHNENAKKHSAETRRKQFASGERVQWNKGKTWKELFSEEKIRELMAAYSNEDRNKKISEKLKGVPKSEEHTKKIIERMENGEFSIDSKNENKFIEEFIIPLGIEFKRQFYIKEIKQFADVYIPSKKILIEYDGDFWHCNPKFYPDGPIYQSQMKKIEKDKIKKEWAEKNGYKLLRFWESDVLGNVNEVINILHKEILI